MFRASVALAGAAGALLVGCSKSGEDPISPSHAEARDPSVRFEEIAAFPGGLLWREPWSPSGQILIFSDDMGLQAFDAAQPDATPTRLTDIGVRKVEWSPDGGWLLGLQWIDHRTQRLITIPLTGDGETEIARGDGIYPFLWGSSGFLYYWDHGELRRADPPQQWSREDPGPLPIHDQYRLVPNDRDEAWEPNLWPAVFRAHPGAEEIVPIPPPEPEVRFFFILDEFTGGTTLLMWAFQRGRSPYAIICDASGRVHETFLQEVSPLPGGRFQSGFIPRSVSADGRFVAGTTSVDDGHVVYESKLHLAQVHGRWVLPIQSAPDGFSPHLSRDGLLLAYGGLEDGLIHVGTVEIARPR